MQKHVLFVLFLWNQNCLVNTSRSTIRGIVIIFCLKTNSL